MSRLEHLISVAMCAVSFKHGYDMPCSNGYGGPGKDEVIGLVSKSPARGPSTPVP